MATNIDDLNSKHRYDEVNDETGEVSHEEWNRLVNAVRECQNPVKAVGVNSSAPQYPDEHGVVRLAIDLTGAEYRAYLMCDRDQNTPIVVSSKDLQIGVRFTGAYMDGGVPVNYHSPGRVRVYVNNEEKAVLPVPSRDYQAEPTFVDSINVGPYLIADMENVVQLRAEFDYEDNAGNMQTVRTQGYVTYQVTYTEVGLEFAGSYNVALVNPTAIPLNYNLKGSVVRTLHVKVSGGSRDFVTEFNNIVANEYTNYYSTWKDTTTVSDPSNTYGFLLGGIITIEAWLTYSDGTTPDANESDHVINQVMVVKDGMADANAPRLLIQNLITNTENYVQAKICSYAVYAPGRSSVSVHFAIRNNNSLQPQEYLSMEAEAIPDTPYDLFGSVGIESEDPTLYAFFFAWIVEGGQTYTFADGEDMITVDNRENFSPVSGADFYLNPSTRSNAEATPLSIVNAANGATIPSTWVNFGAINDAWVQDSENQRVLRVLAGQTLTIGYDWLQPFKTNPAANVTLELDFKARNITNEDDPVFQACEPYGNGFLGLKLRPIEGSVWTASKRTEVVQNFSWQEDVRVHIVVNIVSALRASADNNTNTLALCRIFVNGCINREFMFDKTSSGEWYANGSSIVIGQAGADIDIYNLRVYKNQALDSAEILQNYRSTLPTAADKIRVREENDIVGNNGTISRAKCQEKKKNNLTWHCDAGQITHDDNHTKTGWWEIEQYDDNGNYLPDFSGTLCRETRSIEQTGQGSTAKTYYYWNLQSKLKDVSKAYEKELTNNGFNAATVTLEQTNAIANRHGIWVEVSMIHADVDYTPSTARPGYAYVSDGWVDGNGMYRGPQFKLNGSVPYAQKLVAKINYASAMQSHLMGACNLYNDLHTAIVGRNVMQTKTAGARVAKPQNVFLYFLQTDDNEAAVYQGPCTFGPGKMDDGTWGFKKSNHQKFVMLEGSDNNLPLTDFRVPWDDSRITYELDDGEAAGFRYNGVTSLDLDKFVAQKVTIDGEEVEVPSDDILAHIKQFVNYLYKHNPRIKYFSGTKAQFEARETQMSENEKAAERAYVYFWTEGVESFRLKRYDYVDDIWVDWGWDEENQVTEVFDISDPTNVYYSAFNANRGRYDAMVDALIAAIVADARATIGDIINVNSLKFHYCFTNWMLAGTDNCSKNTYYCLVPYGDANADKSTWTWKWELHQDDQDTIFKTDNSGYQTKPYYIDRMDPCAEGTTVSLYQGGNNVLFNLTEEMYEKRYDELRGMFKQIFSTMSSLVSVNDDLPLENAQKTTPWGCMWKYFFKIQQYIPAVAYNEAARIRYEYPASIPFFSDRTVDPITQSIGDQMQAELQYMKRRLVMLASYAEWGNFSLSSGNVGLTDLGDVFGYNGTSSVVFDGLIPHQYIYPGGRVGESNVYLRRKCKPGVPVVFNMGTAQGTDTAIALYAANYFRSFGNIGDLHIAPSLDFNLKANRLTDFVANPSDPTNPAFSPSSVNLTCLLLERIDLSGSGVGGTLDLKNCIRLRSVNTMGCDGVDDGNGNVVGGIVNVQLPSSQLMTSVQLGSRLVSLTLNDLPNLQMLSVASTVHLTTLVMKGVGSIGGPLVEKCHNENAPLQVLTLTNIQWSGVGRDLLMWVASLPSSSLSGRISVSPDNNITLADLYVLFDRFGNIQSEYNSLYVEYMPEMIQRISITGQKYFTSQGHTQFGISTDKGNNLKFVNGVPALTWQLAPEANNVYMSIDSATGAAEVLELTPNSMTRYLLTVTAELLNGNTISASWKIGFFNRIPIRGDFAFADGTFDDEYRFDKTVVGFVIRVTGSGSTRTIDVAATQNAIITSSDGALASPSVAWGLYPSSDSNGFSTDMQNEIRGQSRNITLYSFATTGSGTGDFQSATKSEAMIEIANEILPGWIRWVWSQYNLPVTPPDYDSALSYSQGAVVSYNGNIYFCKASSATGTFDPSSWSNVTQQYDIMVWAKERSIQDSYPHNMTELGDMMVALQYLQNALGSTNPARFYQLFYPAAYACKMYEPTVMEGEVLDSRYAREKWMLPACGLLRIIYGMYHASRGKTTGSTPNASYANENQENVGNDDYPLMANILKRLADVGETPTKFNFWGNSNFWSASEVNTTFAYYVGFQSGSVNYYNKYTSYVARAVTAFTYTL